MSDLFADPFQALFNLQRNLDSFLGSGWLSRGPSARGSYPPLNVFHKGDEFVVIAELPGVRREDVDIQIKNNTIRIAGIKSVDYGEEASVHRRERTTGRFDRSITIPVMVDADRAQAEYRNGVLALLLPHAEQDKPKSISIA